MICYWWNKPQNNCGFFFENGKSGIILVYIYNLTQHDTEIPQQKKYQFFLLPGIVEFIPEEMKLLANKLTKQG